MKENRLTLEEILDFEKKTETTGGETAGGN